MTAPQIVLTYRPRDYFKKFHGRIQRHSIILCHRRAGKTVAVINDMVVRALNTRKKKWYGAYIGPYKDQAKTIAWAYLKDAVRDVPGVKVNETQTFITFPNGSILRIFGADNPDALRGLYFDMVVLDEVGDIRKRVWSEIIRPALADRKGSAIFMGTPKGKNWFYDQWQKALKSSNWFTLKLTVDDTGIIPASELEEIKEDLDEAEFNQEFMVSWEGSLRGAYYTKQMEAIRYAGPNRTVPATIGKFPHDPRFDVHASMDIGFRDACAIWFWQYIDGRVRFPMYIERIGMDAAETCEMLHALPYRYSTIRMPHDAFHRTYATRNSASDTFVAAGLPVRLVPNPDKGNRVYHGIDIVRKALRTDPFDFDEEGCAPGIEALFNYSRKYDKDRQVYADVPNHDHWSNGADSFRYAATAIAANYTEIQRSLEAAYRSGRLISPISSPAVNTSAAFNGLTLSDMLKKHDANVAAQAANYYRVRN